ncbi:cell wall protein [Streptomyces barkulensis]|uniref:cell wall protein n=1 Tax=Streptomyces barkulensis TaxID=1257026 RepID=UPI000C6D3C91|nr:cell wall protein [Streptomyces barkulensis]
MPREEQEATTTASRRAQPRPWRRVVRWLVDAGLHPRASATTVRVAEDLARRMDYIEGRAIYDLAGTAARLGLSEPTVKRHVRILRELGALVWLEHGSRRNLHLPGQKYTATATVYGAAVPLCFDEAMGHRLEGAGYSDRRVVGVTGAGRERSVAEAQRAADACRPAHDPPSPGGYRGVGKAGVSGGVKDPPRAACPTASSPKKTTSRRRTGRSTGRPAWQVARDIAIARQVRPRVAWTQREGLRRLAYSLRPLIDAGLNAEAIAVELHSWWLDWRPQQPAGFITAELRRRDARAAVAGPVCPTGPTEEFLEAGVAADDDGQEPGIGEGRVRLEDLPREAVVALRSAALEDPDLVVTAVEELGLRDARRLYTSTLVDRALRLRFRLSGHARLNL